MPPTGSETVQVLCKTPALLPHHCSAMTGAGSPSQAIINQENRGQRNKKYLSSP